MTKINDEVNIPIVVGGKILPRLHECFVENHLSTVTTSQEMKKVLAHHFARPGSYLSLFQSSDFVACHWQRFVWLCLDSKNKGVFLPPDAKNQVSLSGKMLHSWLQSEQIRRCILSLMLRIIQRIHSRDDNNMDQEQIKSYTTETDSFEIMTRTIFDIILKSNPLQNMEILSYWIQELNDMAKNLTMDKQCAMLFQKLNDENGTSSLHSFLQALKREAYELVLLFDKMASNDSNDHERQHGVDIHTMLNESLAKCLYEGTLVGLHPEKTKDGTFPLTSLLSFGCDTEENHILDKSLRAEPRRSIAMALSTPENDDLTVLCDPCTAFLTMRGRTAVMSEWFKDFCAFQYGVEDDDVRQRNHFDFGIYQLEHCGIISKMSSNRKNDEVFERVSMVWTSGS